MSIDEIINLIAEKGPSSLQDLSEETNIGNYELAQILRIAEIEGMVYKTIQENQEVWKI